MTPIAYYSDNELLDSFITFNGSINGGSMSVIIAILGISPIKLIT